VFCIVNPHADKLIWCTKYFRKFVT